MSITDQFGDTLINGLLAGARFKGLQEDLKLSRLQRLQLEHQMRYEEDSNALQKELGAAELAQRNQSLSIGELQKRQLQLSERFLLEDRPLTQGAKKAELQGLQLSNKQTKQALAAARRRQPLEEQALQADIDSRKAATASSLATTEHTKENTRGLQAQGLTRATEFASNVGSSLGFGSVDPDANDVIAALTQAGVDKKAMPLLAQTLYASITKTREERDINKRFVAEQLAERQASVERDKAAAIGSAVQSGVLAADIVGRNPQALAGIEAAFADNPVVLALARSGVSKGRDPGAELIGKSLNEQLEAALISKRSAERELLEVEDGTFILRSKKSARAKAQEKIKASDKRIQGLREEITKLFK